MQRVEHLVRPYGLYRMTHAINAVEVVEGLPLSSRNTGTDGIEIAQELLAAQGQGEALHHPVIVSRAARVVAITKRLGDSGVLSHRGLSDRVRDRMAQPLHLGVGCVTGLQVRECFRHSSLRDHRAVTLFVAR